MENKKIDDKEQESTVTDFSSKYTTVPGFLAIHNSEMSDWECLLFGTGEIGMKLTPLKGKEPNWFWRQMQYLILGNKWRKKKVLEKKYNLQ